MSGAGDLMDLYVLEQVAELSRGRRTYKTIARSVDEESGQPDRGGLPAEIPAKYRAHTSAPLAYAEASCLTPQLGGGSRIELSAADERRTEAAGHPTDQLANRKKRCGDRSDHGTGRPTRKRRDQNDAGEELRHP